MKLFALLVSITLCYSFPAPLQTNVSEPFGLLQKVSEQVIDPDYNIPEVKDAPAIPYDERNSPTHAYSVDISFHTTPSDMDCLRDQGYKSVFVRALNPIGNTYFDRNALNTINNAFEGKID